MDTIRICTDSCADSTGPLAPAVATQTRRGIADVTGMGRIDTMILMKPAKADLNLLSRAPALQSSSTPPNRGRALHKAGNPVATGARWSALSGAKKALRRCALGRK